MCIVESLIFWPLFAKFSNFRINQVLSSKSEWIRRHWIYSLLDSSNSGSHTNFEDSCFLHGIEQKFQIFRKAYPIIASLWNPKEGEKIQRHYNNIEMIKFRLQTGAFIHQMSSSPLSSPKALKFYEIYWWFRNHKSYYRHDSDVLVYISIVWKVCAIFPLETKSHLERTIYIS